MATHPSRDPSKKAGGAAASAERKGFDCLRLQAVLVRAAADLAVSPGDRAPGLGKAHTVGTRAPSDAHQPPCLVERGGSTQGVRYGERADRRGGITPFSDLVPSSCGEAGQDVRSLIPQVPARGEETA